MNRCKQWNGTQDNITNKIMNKEGISFGKALTKTRKLVSEFAKENNFNGSNSDKVMFVRNNYSKFINSKL
jgi:hypothetical protein